jgi:hypothetical protein
MHMAKFKVTKVFIVTANTKAEAVELVQKDGAEQLEYVSVKLVEDDPKTELGKWAKGFKQAIVGS